MSCPFVLLEEQPFIPRRHACTHDSHDLALRLSVDDDQHPSLALSDGDESILLVLAFAAERERRPLSLPAK